MSAHSISIVFISDWFAERMGYAENCLPKAMAELGYAVHLITSNVQPYYDSPSYRETYEPFIGPGIVDVGIKEIDGYTLHRLPYAKVRGRLRIKRLVTTLHALHPEIVQTFDAFSITTIEAALAKPILDYKLFLESHLHASVFSPLVHSKGWRQRFKWQSYAATVGRWISAVSEKCYPISIDAAEIAVRFLGIDKQKIEVCSLGVDTALFHPPSDDATRQVRIRFRQQLGFSPSDVVCIYTGRFSPDKNPLCLAQAIGILVEQGASFRGLFIGNGTATEVAAIGAQPGCIVHPFVSVRELVPYYWAADIGVWPKQESTSQLDAAACGLPIVVSTRVQARERIDGNGLAFAEDNPVDLARQIRTLADPKVRQQMGATGAAKIQDHFSWKRIAEQRAQDYDAALSHQRFSR